MRVTQSTVNTELARLGQEVELVKCAGYVRGGEMDNWIDRTVRVEAIRWMVALKKRRADTEEAPGAIRSQWCGPLPNSEAFAGLGPHLQGCTALTHVSSATRAEKYWCGPVTCWRRQRRTSMIFVDIAGNVPSLARNAGRTDGQEQRVCGR
jgi:hypothetical protein